MNIKIRCYKFIIDYITQFIKPSIIPIIVSLLMIVSCTLSGSKYSLETSSNILKLEKISSSFVKGNVVCYDDVLDTQILFVLSSNKLEITADPSRTKIIGSFEFNYIPAQCFVNSESSFSNDPIWSWDVVTTYYKNNKEFMDYYLFSMHLNDNGLSDLSTRKIVEIPVDCNKVLDASYKNKRISFQSKSKQIIYTLNIDTKKISKSDFGKPREFFYACNNALLMSYDDRYIYSNSFKDKSELNNYDVIDTFQNNPFNKIKCNLSPEFNCTAMSKPITMDPVFDIDGSIMSTYVGVGIRMNYEGLFRNTASGRFVATSKALYFIDPDAKRLVKLEDKPSFCLGGAYNVSFVLVFEDNLYKLKEYSCDSKNNRITITDLDFSSKDENVTIHIDLLSNLYLYDSNGVYKVNFNDIVP